MRILIRKWFILRLVFLVSVVLAFLFAFHIISKFSLQHQKNGRKHSRDDGSNIVFGKKPIKTILFWTKFFETNDFYVGFGIQPFSHCPVSNCQTTANQTYLEDSDAVIFHIPNIDIFSLPQVHLFHQRWVYFTLESPEYTLTSNHTVEVINDIFNWTMTYRTDSDVYMPYQGQVSLWDPSKENVFHNVLERKNKLVAWIVSNCLTFSRREKYVEELKEHLNIDVYGSCGSMICKDNTECFSLLSTDYKFYLAFENSLCRDYVTEKFYNALANNIVPIVYGGANYSHFAPKHSFIDVHDFASPKHLADYLKYLEKNQTAYEEYFEWRKTYIPTTYWAWCQLCEMLHNESLPAKSYDDIYKWWAVESHCGENMAINASRLRRKVLDWS